MAIRSTDKDHHVVQVQRGPLRRTKRVTGTLAEARKVEESLIAELVREQELDEAAARLGVDRASPAGRPIPLLRDFYSERWVSHAKVVQNKTTQRARQSSWRYLLYYCGDKRLDELCRPSEVNALVEALKLKGPIVFTKRRNGEPYAPRSKALTNATINGVLSALRSLLNLAHTEGVIPTAPKVDSLPMDDSTPVVPPSEEQFKRLVRAAENFREVAPLLPEVIEFAAETGLRRSELFHLTWDSVELERDAIRVEAQGKAASSTAPSGGPSATNGGRCRCRRRRSRSCSPASPTARARRTRRCSRRGSGPPTCASTPPGRTPGRATSPMRSRRRGSRAR